MEPIHVAIIGGGLAGCTMANGLLKHSNVTFDVFEAGSVFSERGAQISLAINAQNALREMEFDVDRMIKNSGAIKESSAKVIFAEGEHKGAHMFDMEGTFSVHRVQWLEELLKTLPKDRLHTNKKLLHLETRKGVGDRTEILLHFRDGSVHTADAVIGCDGIHSNVRQSVLGESHAAVSPKFANFWDCRNVVPIHTAVEKIGTELFDPSQPVQVCGAGKGVFFFSSPIVSGEAIGIALAGIANENQDPQQWRAPLCHDFLTRKLQNWGPFGVGLADCLMDQDNPEIFYQWESAEAPTFYNQSVCIMGDAAHAMTPWQGAGAGMAIEDAMVLQALFGAMACPSDIPFAFQAYDHMRRKRTLSVIASSSETGFSFCGRGSEGSLEPLKVKEVMLPRWKHIWELDMKAHVRGALTAYRRYRDTNH